MSGGLPNSRSIPMIPSTELPRTDLELEVLLRVSESPLPNALTAFRSFKPLLLSIPGCGGVGIKSIVRLPPLLYPALRLCSLSLRQDVGVYYDHQHLNF